MCIEGTKKLMLTTAKEVSKIRKLLFLNRDEVADSSCSIPSFWDLNSLLSSSNCSRGMNTVAHNPQKKNKMAYPLIVPGHPNVLRNTSVIWETTNMPMAGPEATMPTTTDRHFTKCCRITKLQVLKINPCPIPDIKPNVRYIIHRWELHEAKMKPIIPERDPRMAVNL